MKTMSTVIITVCAVVLIGGCSGQKMTESMGTEMSDMEKPMVKMDSMEDTTDTMSKEPMEKKMNDMNTTTMQ